MLSQRNSLGIKIVGHASLWLLLLCLPIAFSSHDTFDFYRYLKFNLIPLLFHCLLFYGNYLFIINRFLFNKKQVQFVIINLVLVIIAALLVYLLKDMVVKYQAMQPTNSGSHWQSSRRIYKDLLSMIMPVVVSIAARTTEKWSEQEAEKKEKEKESLKSELQHLKYQLQPHFFFNSLNTIYALVENSPQLAQETIHNLSSMMRYMLYDTDKEKVALSEEIDFMKQYIGLMKLRISENTSIEANFPDNTNGYTVTPLLFISLIENAFKHGISAGKSSQIFFSIEIKNNTLTFEAQNTNCPKLNNDQSGSGIGLVNLKKRLELSYPGKHSITNMVEGNLYKATLKIEI